MITERESGLSCSTISQRYRVPCTGPLNKGHFETKHFVHYREVVLFSRRSKNVLLLWEMIILGHYELSFLERLSSFQRVLYLRFHCIHTHVFFCSTFNEFIVYRSWFDGVHQIQYRKTASNRRILYICM